MTTVTFIDNGQVLARYVVNVKNRILSINQYSVEVADVKEATILTALEDFYTEERFPHFDLTFIALFSMLLLRLATGKTVSSHYSIIDHTLKSEDKKVELPDIDSEVAKFDFEAAIVDLL